MSTEMGEGREPGTGEGSMDEGGGQFLLTSRLHHPPKNLSQIQSVSNDFTMNI